MFRPKSLRQRMTFFLLLPLIFLLIGVGLVGFTMATKFLLFQWNVATILRLQRAAHDVDARLADAIRWVQLFHDTTAEPGAKNFQRWLLKEAQAQDGIERAQVIWNLPSDTRQPHTPPSSAFSSPKLENDKLKAKKHLHRTRITRITPPRYDNLVQHKTVSILSDLLDDQGNVVGQLAIAVRFDYLMGRLMSTNWWKTYKACLVDDNGAILVGNFPDTRKRLADNNDPLELRMLQAIRAQPFGTLIGEGRPAKEVGGFCRLQNAPWSLVVIAPGKKVLGPIIKFRVYYLLLVTVLVFMVIVVIRLATGGTVAAIKELADATDQVADGQFDITVPVRGDDEVAHLVGNFNTMVRQLEERIRLKEALDLAMEVQQSLLPKQAPQIPRLEIAGRSIYCDETGGDYYDFLQFAELGEGRLVVAVGDVVGHGISAALLMTTVRAFLRSRLTQPGSLGEIITDVNRLLCLDTSESGSFMTLFAMLIDTENNELRWVRAGHDPAIIYNSLDESFTELRGSGIALGFDETIRFQEYRYGDWNQGQIILIGTDGIWETESPEGEQFGKKRLNDIVRNCRELSPEEILNVINEELMTFRGNLPQHDDVTLVVVKTKD